MPMYFFDVQEQDGSISRDVVGVELKGDSEALDAASQTLLDAINDTALQRGSLKIQVVVRNESGLEIGRQNADLRSSD